MFIFVVKPLGTCHGWGSSPSVALLSTARGSVCGTGRSSSGGTSRRHWWGGFLSLGRRGGVHRRRGRRAVGGDRVRRSAAATLDACRALLADHLSYGDRWGNPPAGA
ncbi:unnamed protein product [Pleuronectes platessa]|uniref:Uncharacterized protein n=1 Tax=Pleuronectes platessa TaxID=8262 RepID=A0A9N7VPE1_PLEPL|nr:unnamed protein product [Pleuronectes platessa]